MGRKRLDPVAQGRRGSARRVLNGFWLRLFFSSTPSFRSLSTSPPDALMLSGAAHTSGESRRSEEELRGSRGLFGGDPLPGCSAEDGDGQHAGEMPADLDSKN